MRFSFRQILASTAGAVIAAIIASLFGVKGTIVGVAIGSAAATMATAFVAQSIERGHEAVKQVVVKAPETATLLRKLGGTGASGSTSAPTEVVRSGGAGAETVEMASTAAPVGETERLEISAVADAPATERLQAHTSPSPSPSTARRTLAAAGFSWRAIAATAGVVFVLALLCITAVELISGKPLTAIFGGADTGTTVKNLVNPPPASPTTTTTTTTPSTSTSTTSGSSTTTTTTAGTTTSTTASTGGATATTSPAPASSTTTTTTGPGAASSTTTTSAGVSP